MFSPITVASAWAVLIFASGCIRPTSASVLPSRLVFSAQWKGIEQVGSAAGTKDRGEIECSRAIRR